MKRKKTAFRSRILTCLLLAGSLACAGLCLAHMIPYFEEEMRTASLHAELAALHEGGTETGGDCDAREPDVPEGSPSALSEGEGQTAAVENDGNAGPEEDVETPETSEDAGEEAEDAETARQTAESRSGLAALHQKNADCIAWITIEGTAIDYPVMYGPQNKA